jgi:competence CoiA-like predicted nuclease
MAQWEYAIREKDDKIVNIAESDVKNGLSCGCLCFNCKAKMVAKKGKKREYHFAHYNEDDGIKCGEVGNGNETALHYLVRFVRERN